MAVNVKIGADIGGFKSQIQQGQSILKGLNAEMKATEAEFKATGNAEKALEQKTKTLNSQLQVQKGIADQAAQALKSMEEAGIKPTDAAYQKMYATMMNATAGMNEAQAALNGLGQSANQAATNADALNNSVNSIGKKISLDQVISGINSITSGLENAAKKAIQLGEDLWNAMMQSAQLADDIGTQARILDMTPEQYQQYKGVFDTIGEITISEWASAKRKVQKAINDPTQDQIDVLAALGITTHGEQGGKFGVTMDAVTKDWETLFWEAGTALKQKVESGQISQDLADTYGEMLFGKKFSSMKTLIDMGREAFGEALKQQTTASDDAIKKDAELNDAVIKLQNSFEALKMEVLSGLAPALTSAVGTIDSFLGTIMEYLKSPEGQEALTKLGYAVSGLFDDLGSIDPASVVDNFTNVFNTLVSSLQWIVENKDTLIGALKGVVVAWGALELTGGALQIMKLIDGLKDLGIIGGKGAPKTTGAEATAAGDGKSGWLTGLLENAVNGLATKSVLDEVQEIYDNANKAAEEAKNAGDDALVFFDALAQQSMESGYISEEKMKEIQEFNEKLFANTEPVEIPVEPVVEENYAAKIAQSLTDADAWNFGDMSLDEIMEQINGGQPVEVPADLDVETKPADISEQIGTVTIPAVLNIGGMLGHSEYWGSGGGGVNIGTVRANGLPFVPYDGYLAQLHKGERVVPAREVASRNFSSNLYVENMNMNGGVSADALAAAIAGRNRRMMAGYGS